MRRVTVETGGLGRGEEYVVPTEPQNNPWIGRSATESEGAATGLLNYGLKVRQPRDYLNVVEKTKLRKLKL
jgi:hypothetical protein